MKILNLKCATFCLLSILSTSPAYADCPKGKGFIFDNFVGPKVSRRAYISVIASDRWVKEPVWCFNGKNNFSRVSKGSFWEWNPHEDVLFKCGDLKVRIPYSQMMPAGWRIDNVAIRTKSKSLPWVKFSGAEDRDGDYEYTFFKAVPEGIDKETGRYSTRYIIQRMFYPDRKDLTSKVLTVTTIVRSKSACEKVEIF